MRVSLIDQLYSLHRDANYDESLRVVTSPAFQLEELLRDPDAVQLSLSQRRALCDTLYYAGRYEDASRIFETDGSKARDDLNEALTRKSLAGISEDKLKDLQSRCDACLSLGLVLHYSRNEVTRARELFESSERVLSRIHSSLPIYDSLTRANYCLGLIDRNEHKYDTARDFFSRSIDFAWEGLTQFPSPSPSGALEFAIGKAMGLGLAWVAYTRAALPDANAHVVAARLLVKNKGVRYVRANIEVVHACSLISAHADDIDQLNRAIRILKVSFDELGGAAALDDSSKGHSIWALRAANELAAAHYRTGHYFGLTGRESEKLQELETALEYVALLKGAERLRTIERRTYCNAFVLESRIRADQKNYRDALKQAEEANEIGSDMEFSRIDCWLTLGAARYQCGDYFGAIKCFLQAYDDAGAQTNPKVLAVCNLQLARCFIATGQLSRAQERYRLWEATGRRGQENAFVRELNKEVQKAFGKDLAPFVIEPGAELRPDEYLSKLRSWMAVNALRRTHNRVDAARILDISPRALKYWEDGGKANRAKQPLKRVPKRRQ